MPEIPKTYTPQAVETKWYQFWLEQKCFVADAQSQKAAYSIVIPPPNVTGILHMGHVLNNTIQDILARKARMDGKEVLWLPGTDHAGIATQVQVEKKLKKEEKISRRDLGREKFLERVWEWKEKHGGIIIDQLKRLGASCDWTRERFTMDPEYSKCVTMVFVDLYKKGLIYRGKRMVNWCPGTLTALSDEEVIMKEQKGSFYYFKVEVFEEPGRYLTIGTTRPETIPGDTAVAVNPKDPRYSALIGKHVVRPLPAEFPAEKKLIPIIADDHVDFEFGTGILKVTPAHDKADFEIGQRHKLAVVEVINADGTMNELAGADLNGHDRFKARKLAAEKLTELGLLEKEEPYTNNVGFSERADVPIEPRLSEQWFLKYPSVAEARACVGNGRFEKTENEAPGGKSLVAHPVSGKLGIQPSPGAGVNLPNSRAEVNRSKMHFYPDRWAKVYDHWMSNIQDWCISRQLWWGHRIPVWTQRKWEFPAARIDELLLNLLKWQEEERIVVRSKKEATIPDPGKSLEETRQHESVAIFDPDNNQKIIHFLEQLGYERDPDVLDTWFSSWLWPFATMTRVLPSGEFEETDTIKKFYPTTDLVTGPDIIFFWVARMIMAGFEYMGELPFRNVYFTGIIRDKLGRKMSKTLGNSPDPLDLMDRYSADALRFGVMRSAPLGQDVLFDEQHVELGRNFCTKLWNACRFRQMQGDESQGEIDPRLLNSDDKWILLRLDKAIREITEALNGYKFNEAAQALYRFFWSEFCDWYLEATKAVFYGEDTAQKANTNAVIDFVLSHTLRLFHPFLPFITEELWHGLGYHEEMPENQGGKTIMNAPWPKPFDHDFLNHYPLDESDERLAQSKYDLITAGRNLRREGSIQSSKRVKFVFKPAAEVNAHDREVFKILLNAESLEVNPNYAAPKGTPVTGNALGEIYLPLEGLIDPAAEKARLSKEKEKAVVEIEKVQQKLNNSAFTQKVPPAVLEEHKKRLADWEGKLAQIQRALDALV